MTFGGYFLKNRNNKATLFRILVFVLLFFASCTATVFLVIKNNNRQPDAGADELALNFFKPDIFLTNEICKYDTLQTFKLTDKILPQ